MLSDFHIHTEFSGDSEELAENHIKRAISLGMQEICFTEHHDYGVICDTDYTLDFERYFPYMKALQEKYQDQLAIRIGVEMGLQCRISSYLKDLEGAYPFDYIIGSSHFVDGVDPYEPEYWAGKTDRQAFQEFFESSLKRVQELDSYDSYGHLDYVVRYGKNQNKYYHWEDFEEIIDEILKLLIQKGKALECNTGGFRYGLGQPNPTIPILKRYRELGGTLLTMGSDAHKADTLGISFPEMQKILLDLGFKSYLTFEKRKPIEHSLK